MLSTGARSDWLTMFDYTWEVENEHSVAHLVGVATDGFGVDVDLSSFLLCYMERRQVFFLSHFPKSCVFWLPFGRTVRITPHIFGG